ncbi:MAG: phage terminase large subunit family protein [Nitrospinae bacterium]|nr:phage terminase large subunit family protein [Nitrospinota bacterium]
MQSELSSIQIPLNPPFIKGESDRQGDFIFPFTFYPSERRVFEKREPLTVSQWAEKYRTVPIGAHRGPWRNDISPHLIKIMDIWGLPHIREIIICKAPQTGGSEAMLNCAAYAMDRHPSTMMFVMPSEAISKKVNSDRIIPMIEQSHALRKLISPNPDDMAKLRVKLNNGNILYMAHSNSSAALATFPVKFLFFDETDKYPPFVGKESDPITLGEKRARTFKHTYKIFKVSTPTREEGHIWKALQSADVLYKYYVSCPHCKIEQIMSLDNLKWPDTIHPPLNPLPSRERKTLLSSPHAGEGQDEGEKVFPEQIRRENLAYYECPHCKSRWTDIQRDKAVRAGEWKREKGKDIQRPRSVAFHLPAWISPDVSLSEIASAYLLSKSDKAKLIDFYNDYLAEPFVESQQGDSLKEDDLYARRYCFTPKNAVWQIPMGGCILSAYADIQANRIEVCVIAWGQGFQSWAIERVQLPGDTSQSQVWGDLDRYLLKEWQHESGAKLKIVTAGIDSGYLAPDVYRFVRVRQLGRRVYATKGSSTVGKPLISVTDPRKRKGNDKNKVTLIMIGTETAKDTLFARLQIEAPGPGYVHFSDSLDYDFFKQLCAEQCLTKYKGGRPYRVWDKKRKDARNEALDLFVGNLAVIELLNPNFDVIVRQITAVAQGQKIQIKKTGRRIISKGV